MSVITEIADYLEDEGVGTLGTNLFYSYMPENINTGISVLDTGGMTPDPYLPTHEPTFQIFIRATSYDAGKALLESVRDALHRLTNTTLGSTHYYFILAMSEGGHIGRDETGRDEFSINFRCRTR